MRVTEFPNNRAYVAAQRASAKRKYKAFYWDEEARILAGWFERRGLPLPHKVLCHGVRFGVDSFTNVFNAQVIGTDIFQMVRTSIAVKQFKQWDFRRIKPEWRGQFDMVYSNSLDHSNQPSRTLRIWLDQLNPNGHLIVNWTPYHDKVYKGDCFGARLDEYYEILAFLGTVVDLLRCRKGWYLFIVEKKK